MKKLLWSIGLLTIMLFAFKPAAEILPIGSALPKATVQVQDITGKEISMQKALKANGLLVMFSCNTCPYVIRNQDRTKEICAYALKNNIGVILLNANEGSRNESESLAEMQAYGKQQGYNWYYAVDKNNVLADAFGANRTPECFLFNKDAKLVYHGAIDDNPQSAANVQRHHLKEAMNETITGKEVSVKESRSVGCNIKRI